MQGQYKSVIIWLMKVRLPPEVSRIIFVRNLPFKINADELYDIFGKYGAIRQIRKYFLKFYV